MANYHTGLIIGRFQPFHYGHEYLIRKALTYVHALIIGIGSANSVISSANPYPYAMRLNIIQEALKTNNWTHRIAAIFPSNDVPDDAVWLQDTLQHAGEIDVVIGNNDWVNGIFRDAGFPVIELTMYNRDDYEGTKIRRLMERGNEEWKKLVPEYIVPFLHY